MPGKCHDLESCDVIRIDFLAEGSYAEKPQEGNLKRETRLSVLDEAKIHEVGRDEPLLARILSLPVIAFGSATALRPRTSVPASGPSSGRSLPRLRYSFLNFTVVHQCIRSLPSCSRSSASCEGVVHVVEEGREVTCRASTQQETPQSSRRRRKDSCWSGPKGKTSEEYKTHRSR